MARWSRYNNDDFGYPKYVPVAKRKQDAQKKIKAMTAKGETMSPVEIEGRTIAKTFWGKAWCDNIESYHDYENRLPRGRSYVRNGSVIDLKITKGKITAMVQGSELYEINITIQELAKDKWDKIKRDCAGKIGSLIDLIKGKLSPEIIEILCKKTDGMFPSPKEIKMICNCPDWADLCKHLAAVLYGVGARLDKQPELFFLLRGVDQNELLSADLAGTLVDSATPAAIADHELNNIFGIELDILDDEIVVSIPIPIATAERKKPGRPRKTESAPKPAAAPVKRGPGRPRKSKTTPAAPKAKSTPKTMTRKVSKIKTSGKKSG